MKKYLRLEDQLELFKDHSVSIFRRLDFLMEKRGVTIEECREEFAENFIRHLKEHQTKAFTIAPLFEMLFLMIECRWDFELPSDNGIVCETAWNKPKKFKHFELDFNHPRYGLKKILELISSANYNALRGICEKIKELESLIIKDGSYKKDYSYDVCGNIEKAKFQDFLPVEFLDNAIKFQCDLKCLYCGETIKVDFNHSENSEKTKAINVNLNKDSQKITCPRCSQAYSFKLTGSFNFSQASTVG